MTEHVLDLEPLNEKKFLLGLLEGTYLPAQAGLNLQDMVVVRYKSDVHGHVRLYAMVVGRCFDGPSRVPSRVKVISTTTQRNRIRDMLDELL